MLENVLLLLRITFSSLISNLKRSLLQRLPLIKLRMELLPLNQKINMNKGSIQFF